MLNIAGIGVAEWLLLLPAQFGSEDANSSDSKTSACMFCAVGGHAVRKTKIISRYGSIVTLAVSSLFLMITIIYALWHLVT